MLLSFIGGRLGAPLEPEEVGKLDQGTFSSSPGLPPGVLLPAEYSSCSGTSKNVEEAIPFIVVPQSSSKRLSEGILRIWRSYCGIIWRWRGVKKQGRASPPKVAGETS